MVGTENLSTFTLKPLKSFHDWEDAQRWKLYFEALSFRQRHVPNAVDAMSVDDSELFELQTIKMEMSVADVLEVLTVQSDHFNRHYWITESGDVMKEIRARMRRQGFRNRDLVEEIGSKGYVSDILNRRKGLTLRTARIFKDIFDIPAEWLLSDYYDS